MNALRTLTIAQRLNALAAAAVVTLTLLAGIATLATNQSAATQMAQAALAQPA
jgi:hypothetical protein